jgi:diaminohydroxyphosphoribosylaminopyrimidine deaminase/5-amino-6-(5-phosphoribosylamino)uracil reductase
LGDDRISGDERWMAAALALAERGRGRTAPNPNVGCIVVDGHGRVVGRGWTQPGGRPHAEAMALAQAGGKSRGATAYVTLEPCAHVSLRGPACSKLLIDAGIARVVTTMTDFDRRTQGKGIERLEYNHVAVTNGVLVHETWHALAGFRIRATVGRPMVTLKLALSLDGCIATAKGESQWITGPEARAHAHLQRALHDAILVGRATVDADDPRLDVRLPGLEDRSPRRILLSRQEKDKHYAERGWQIINRPWDITKLEGVDALLVEGGAATATAFLRDGLVDRLLIYRAPVVLGGKPGIGNYGLLELAHAHGMWKKVDERRLGSDTLEVYDDFRVG